MVSNTAAAAKYIKEEITWLCEHRSDEEYQKRMTQLENEIAIGMRLCDEERTANADQSHPPQAPERAPHAGDQKRQDLV